VIVYLKQSPAAITNIATSQQQQNTNGQLPDWLPNLLAYLRCLSVYWLSSHGPYSLKLLSPIQLGLQTIMVLQSAM
jgi:hypothetical protein